MQERIRANASNFLNMAESLYYFSPMAKPWFIIHNNMQKKRPRMDGIIIAQRDISHEIKT